MTSEERGSGSQPDAERTMSDYDRSAWENTQSWRQRRSEGGRRGALPTGLRERVSQLGSSGAAKLREMPGIDGFEAPFFKALQGLTDLGSRAARASVRRDAIVRAYRKRGYDVSCLADIRTLNLTDVDDVMPRLDVAYITGSSAEGMVAGLAVSGGQILATGGAVAGAGAGAAPGAATVVGAMAADAAAVLVATERLVAHVAAYYGYDVEDPGERLFSLGVLGVGTAPGTGKTAAFFELNQVVQGLARNHTWQQLSQHTVTRIVQQVYKRLGIRLTQRKLASAVPVLGAVLGGGLNAHTMTKVADDARHLYRERFLRERYNLAPRQLGAANSDAVPVAEIVDEPHSPGADE